MQASGKREREYWELGVAKSSRSLSNVKLQRGNCKAASRSFSCEPGGVAGRAEWGLTVLGRFLDSQWHSCLACSLTSVSLQSEL